MIRCTMDRLSVASPSLASNGYRQKSCNQDILSTRSPSDNLRPACGKPGIAAGACCCGQGEVVMNSRSGIAHHCIEHDPGTPDVCLLAIVSRPVKQHLRSCKVMTGCQHKTMR